MTGDDLGKLDPALFADLLAGYCLDVQSGEQVLVRSTSLAAPLLLELNRAILERGGWPMMRIDVPGLGRSFYEHAREWQLDEFADLSLHEARKCQKQLGIQAPEDMRALVDIDPAKIARAARARQVIREATMKKRWCSTLWPTEANAAHAGLSVHEFADFIAGALFLDRPAGPVAAWAELGAFQEQLIGRLKKVRQIRIESAGTDITLDVKGRTWVNSDGRRNMPSGEVFTGPLETSASGRIHFDIPSSPAGVQVSGVDLEFVDGKVVSASAAEGEEYLRHAIGIDEGASLLGELGIGTNFGIDRPVGAILFDEKIGGTVHLALGRSYPETGGKNVSALHWDLICDLRKGGTMTADGVVIQRDGTFV